MKKLTLPALLSLGLLFGAIGCVDQAKTSSNAPNTTQDQPKPLNTDEAQKTQEDAQSQVRRDQLNSDIRSREQRNNVANNGSAMNRDDSDLASQVRSKLEANIPASALVVDAKEGVITVSGTVPTTQQLAKIEPLAKEIKGVQTVNVTAEVVPAQPNQKTN